MKPRSIVCHVLVPGRKWHTVISSANCWGARFHRRTRDSPDCKTGMPRTADHLQVLISMFILPCIRPAWKDKIWHGNLCYHDSMANIPATAIDESFRALLRRTMEQVGGATGLAAVLTYAECRFCDMSRQDCPQRIEAPP